ncbi:hypothetical protein E2562_002454 [Oryza meyeriana var. granulata]|uniref:Neprosin PEP catalytic domain-containing protein n=1 Tax=Oryza meyeriana var. granulata TaxID=110450 RepID=A0A6G1F2P3_9ORYZ|nr:hypothetical protein E2562_002454 [Oryza meyeriana var. granulata]
MFAMEEKLAINIITLCLSYLVLAAGVTIYIDRDEIIDSTILGNDANMTIQTGDGDVYDCVDIYKQPSLNHPLLKNHTIQMEPSSYPLDLDIQSMLSSNSSEAHLPYANCPIGIIPILRNGNKDTMPLLLRNGPTQEEYAAIKYWDDNNFYATRATLNVYQPFLAPENGDHIASWAQLNNGPEEIGTGSIVWPSFSGDNFARFHIRWVDSSNKPCYDFKCPGFVQVSELAAIGGRITPVSVYNGPQYIITVMLFQDRKTKDWWLARLDKSSAIRFRPLGYWPSKLFDTLQEKVSYAFWGGWVRGPTVSSDPPLMGSGHFAKEGYKKAAFVKDIKIANRDNNFVNPSVGGATPVTSRLLCYTVDGFGVIKSGMHVFFGGPGQCPK